MKEGGCTLLNAAMVFCRKTVCAPFAMASVLIAFLLQACDLPEAPTEEVVLTVGSRRVTADELRKDLVFIGVQPGDAWLLQAKIREQVIDSIIDRYLILEYCTREGITLSEGELERALADIMENYTEDSFHDALLRGTVDYEYWKARLAEHLLLQKVMKTVAEEIRPPSYEEIERYFELHKEELKTPRMVKFRQIVTRSKADAEEILKRLSNGETFEELARECSVAPEAVHGGEVGWISEGQLDKSMEEVLFSLPEDVVSPVVTTPYGHHIFQVLSFHPEGTRELPDVIDEIESRLLQEKREAFFEEWLKGLRGDFPVHVSWPVLESMGMS